MSDDYHDRRASDKTILEMHGMLAGLIQRMDDHIKVDDQVHEHLLAVDKRVIPLEEFHGNMKTLGKGLAITGTPILLGAGTWVWLWIKGILSHTSKVGQ